MPDRRPDEISRRLVLRGAALGGVTLPLLAACGGGTDTAEPPAPTSSGGGAQGGLASTADVPVGGGEILAEQKIVLTQPVEGDFKAFSAVCTHQGCTVNSVSDGVIHCACHGSRYSIEDGSVLGGPAPTPLPEVPITVEGGEIVKA